LFKFWMHVTKEEQLKRFEERANDKLRNWKLTDEDWRNREKWDQYEEAVNEMLLKTSTLRAPWTVIEGNDKYYARIKVLKTIVDKLQQELK
jgi:AMP-polyphosphate phosphotransferase